MRITENNKEISQLKLTDLISLPLSFQDAN